MSLLNSVEFDKHLVDEKLIGYVINNGKSLLKEARVLRGGDLSCECDDGFEKRLVESIHRIICLGRFSRSEAILSVILLNRTFEVHKVKGNFGVFCNYTDLIFMMVTSLILSHKCSNDVCFRNSQFCANDWGNLSVQTLNAAEMHMLKTLEFDLRVSEKEFSGYVGFLRLHDGL
jgi:hypothetical protein